MMAGSMRLDFMRHTKPNYHLLSNAVRFLAIDMVNAANSGHPGLPMGMADVATVLFQNYMTFTPHHPNWLNRDRFVLSAGHGSAMLYALLYLCGYPDMTLDQLKNFRKLGSLTPGHPEYGHTPGVDTTTGPLGQGFANAVGMAVAEKLIREEYGEAICDHYTYVIASDGDLMEGISQEALSFAGHNELGKLIVFFDDNHITIDGSTDLSTSDNQMQRFSASNWHVQAIDGHDHDAIHKAIQAAQASKRPSMIACRTTIGYGSPNKAGTSGVHGSPLGHDEAQKTRDALSWSYEPFFIPEDLMMEWRLPGQQGQQQYNTWFKAFSNLKAKDQQRLVGDIGCFQESLSAALHPLRTEFMESKPEKATRTLSQTVLDAISPHIPGLVGGSADLTPSNNTQVKGQARVCAPVNTVSLTHPQQHYIHYGVREHAMAAMMNGMRLHRGIIPYGGTFLIFSDYMRPSMRLSALMELGIIYVLTHDSIGLGEDGPTHQPIEHLASLRAIPNMHVVRPCDAIEVLEAWEIALTSPKTPTILALSRQNLPFLRDTMCNIDINQNYTRQGAYILKDTADVPNLTLVASGSEVYLALDAARALDHQNIKTRVVSAPCLDLFKQQNKNFHASVLGTAPRVFIEAGCDQSWHPFMRSTLHGEYMDAFIGMKSFGASAPAADLYSHFGITVDAIIETGTRLIC